MSKATEAAAAAKAAGTVKEIPVTSVMGKPLLDKTVILPTKRENLTGAELQQGLKCTLEGAWERISKSNRPYYMAKAKVVVMMQGKPKEVHPEGLLSNESGKAITLKANMTVYADIVENNWVDGNGVAQNGVQAVFYFKA